jgi:fucose 4-O-acetylase-like acetyltransferase
MKSIRFNYIDIFKAYCIIAVVIGHTWSPWTPYIYLFHVPAFFFISGFVYKKSESNLFSILIKRGKQLLFPFITVNLIFLGLLIGLKLTHLFPYFYNISFNSGDIVFLFKRIFVNFTAPTDLGGATWFLTVLFCVSILSHIVISFKEKNNIKDWVLLLIAIILIYAGYSDIVQTKFSMFSIDLAFVGSFYYIIGHLCSKHNIFKKQIDLAIALPISILIIFFFGKLYFVPMNWPTRSFSDTPVINIITSLAGIYVCYLLSIMTDKIKWLSNSLAYVGRRTLSILMFHFLGFRIFFVIMVILGIKPQSLLLELIPQAGNTYWWIISIFSIVFCLIIENLLSKWSLIGYFLFGKNTQKYDENLKKLFIKDEKLDAPISKDM